MGFIRPMLLPFKGNAADASAHSAQFDGLYAQGSWPPTQPSTHQEIPMAQATDPVADIRAEEQALMRSVGG